MKIAANTIYRNERRNTDFFPSLPDETGPLFDFATTLLVTSGSLVVLSFFILDLPKNERENREVELEELEISCAWFCGPSSIASLDVSLLAGTCSELVSDDKGALLSSFMSFSS